MKDLAKTVKKIKDNFFPFLPLILLLVLITLLSINLVLKFAIHNQALNDSPFYISSNFKFPIIKNEYDPRISAKGAVVMDGESKTVLFSRNPYIRFSSASTTKIMTAVTALEYFKPEDVLTIRNNPPDGVVLGLVEGETYTFENLLFAMLLPSANDAALAIAQNYPGGEKEFIKKMNENAVKFNLFNTHFGDSSGLMDEKDFTTPHDLARLAAVAMENEEFAKVVSTQSKVITDTTGLNIRSVDNLNRLLGYKGVNGVKTGFTEEAGQVLVTSKKEGEHVVIFVVMNSLDRFLDSQKLIDMISNNITYLSIHP